jgi:FkbM family methyltransferase
MTPETPLEGDGRGAVTRIDQVLPTLASRDAIGEHALHVQRALRSHGYLSELFFGDASPDRVDAGLSVSRIDDFPTEGRVLLYHLSIGSPVSDIFRDRPERKFVYYHNVTPAELLAPWLPHVGAQARQGRFQLRELAPVTELAFAASTVSERELFGAGYRATATSPLLFDPARFAGQPDPGVASRLGAGQCLGGTDLLFVGKISPHKGQADLIKVLATYRRTFDPLARLHLVGGAISLDYQNAVLAFAAKLGLADAVEITGSVTDEELSAYYQGSDVFVCLSEHEGFCVPLAEAMYHDLPIVTWDSTALAETVGGAGLVLPDKDPALISTAIARVVKDETLRRYLSAEASAQRGRYSLERTRRQFIRAIETAVGADPTSQIVVETDVPAVRSPIDQALFDIQDDVRRRRASGDLPASLTHDLDAQFREFAPRAPQVQSNDQQAFVPQRIGQEQHPLPVAAALHLLFPSTPTDRLTSLAAVWGDSASVRSPSDLRLLLGAVDHDMFASPVEVHIGREDIVVVEVDGISLALDRHDHAISRPIIDGVGHDPWLADIATTHCRPGMTVIDVGANVGYFTMLAWAAVGNMGRVVAVEPRSDNCRLLLLSAGLNGAFTIELLPLAADRNRGLAHLGAAIGTNGGFVSDEPSALLDGSAVIVPTFPLDELIEGPVHLIKVDVEGAEGRVIDGAASIISSHRPVVVTELSPTMLEAVSAITCEEYLARFVELDYEIHEIDPVGRNTGYAIDLPTLLSRWGDPDTIRNLILLPRITGG